MNSKLRLKNLPAKSLNRSMNVNILRAGFLSTIQDLGRSGWRQFGVSVGGALDAHALRVANNLAGNDERAAGLEITSGLLRLRFNDERIIAWCGGEFNVTTALKNIPAGHSARVEADQEISISGPRRGCRGWLALSGGIDLPVVLDSRATDLRARFGGFDGRVLRDGDDLPLGKKSNRARLWIKSLAEEIIASWSAPRYWARPIEDNPVLRFIRGAHWNLFQGRAHKAFFTERFTVTAESDRMGARLEGAKLERREGGDLISEAVAPGTIQVPPNGQPIVLLGDCQTIGGYPKIAHVITVDFPIAAQLREGDRVRFVEVSLPEALRLLLEREREIERFRVGLSLHGR
jgi:antagonist of KipI